VFHDHATISDDVSALTRVFLSPAEQTIHLMMPTRLWNYCCWTVTEFKALAPEASVIACFVVPLTMLFALAPSTTPPQCISYFFQTPVHS
jgi:hypothetical protein